MSASDPWDRLANQSLMSIMALRDRMVLPEVSPYNLPTWGEEQLPRHSRQVLRLRGAARAGPAAGRADPADRRGRGAERPLRALRPARSCASNACWLRRRSRRCSGRCTVPGRGVYWDGLFSQNPPIHDLIEHQIDELWVIQINPSTCARVPTETHEILDRRNALAGNLSMEQELKFIEMLNRGDRARAGSPIPSSARFASRASRWIAELGYRSKLDRRPELLDELREYGRTKWRWFLKERESRFGRQPHHRTRRLA